MHHQRNCYFFYQQQHRYDSLGCTMNKTAFNSKKTFSCKKQKQCFIIKPVRWKSNFHFVWDWHIIFMLLNCIKKYFSLTIYISTEMKHERIFKRTHSQSIFIYSFHVNPRKKGVSNMLPFPQLNLVYVNLEDLTLDGNKSRFKNFQGVCEILIQRLEIHKNYSKI